MIVQFCTTTKRTNSTLQPTMTASYDCTLKEGCSVVNPIIILNRKIIGHSYNYAYIADFGRYYWIRNIVYENARMFFFLECDPLASYKTEIGSSSVYVTRSASDYNGYIVDNMYPLTNEIEVDREVLASLSIVSVGRCYVVTIVGNDAENGTQEGLHYYGFTPAGLDSFFKQLLSTTYTDQIVDRVWGQLNENLKLLVDPLQYISCVKMYPFTLNYPADPGQPVKPGELSTKTIPVGFGTISCECAEWGNGFRTPVILDTPFSIKNHPQIARGAYLNGSQFTDCKFYTPFGVFDVDVLALAQAEDSRRIQLSVDITTGTGRLQVYARDTNDYYAYPWIGNSVIDCIGSFGVDVPVSQIVAGGMDYLGGLSGALGSMGSALTGNYVGAVTGFIGSTVGMIGQGVANSIPKAHTTGQKGSDMNFSRDITAEYVWRIVVDDDNTQHGKPLCEVRQINTLSGFLMAEKPDIAISGTREEADKINAELTTGIFYE